MKKLLILLLIVTICCSVFALAACNLDNTNDDDNNKNNDSNTVALSDLPQYMANINGASAFGILPKKQIASRSNETRTTESNTNKNYLVMTNEEYDSNRPSVDENGLLKVTFSRIVTENVATEITGTKFVIAKESQISFTSIENFTYSVYLGEQCLCESVCDNDTNDINKRNGYITLNNMVNDNRYEIRYTGIGKEEKITQDEIDGEIDKMYVMGNYTFVSFVPVGMSNREYEIDSQLSSKYDTYGYYSDSERQSFVIDNLSGYIYLIENNMSINEIGEGLVKINGKIYDITINNNDELQFTQVVKNETLNIYRFFKDKYGNKYIHNDILNCVDKANKTLYFTNALNYLISKEGIVIAIDCQNTNDWTLRDMTVQSVYKVMEEFSMEEIDENETYNFNKMIEIGQNDVYIWNIKGGRMYMTQYDPFYYTFYYCININSCSFESKWFGTFVDNPNVYSRVINEHLVLLIEEKDDKLLDVYYAHAWNENGHHSMHSQGTIDKEISTLLLENCQCTTWNDVQNMIQEDGFVDGLKFQQVTLDKTIYYKIVLSEQGIPQIVNTETYVAPNQESIILQPINK